MTPAILEHKEAAIHLRKNNAILDSAGNLLFLNLAIDGVAENSVTPDMSGMRWLEFVHPDDVAALVGFFASPSASTTSFRAFSIRIIPGKWCRVDVCKMHIGLHQFCVFEVTAIANQMTPIPPQM